MKAVREKPRTLKRIRADACPQDRNCEALKLTPAPASSPANAWYLTADRGPQTLEQLRTRCGLYGDAAVSEACWGAVTTWLMKGPGPGELTQPSEVANTSVWLCAREREDRGYPDLSGKRTPATLPLLSAASQDEARSVAAQTIVDWRKAGSPYLAESIQDTHRYIAAYIRTFPKDPPEAFPN